MDWELGQMVEESDREKVAGLRHQAEELKGETACIISDHDDLQDVVDKFGIPVRVYKLTKAYKEKVEEEELTLLKETYNADLVILTRYIQIISDKFCTACHHAVIHVHHSILPAFIRRKLYHRAHVRGVKFIGATALMQQQT